MKQSYLRIILGKFPVKVKGGEVALELPGLGHMIFPLPINADIRTADRMTLYTECPTKGIANAPSGEPPIE